MFQDGIIAQAVDVVKATGVSYFSAAGNNGRDSYEAPFDPSDSKPMQDFAWMRSVLQIFASRASAEIERLETEEKIREAVDRYALATDAAKVGIWDWNIQTNKFYLDPKIKASLGYDDYEPTELKGCLQFVHPEDRKSVMDATQA